MKTLLLVLTLATAGVNTASAQIYRPAVVNGAVLGGIAGAIIGGHNHDRWGEGAIIGAAAGALLGSTVPAPREVIYQAPPVTVVQNAPAVPMAATVPTAPTVAVPATSAPVVVSQPTQVVYVPYYAPAPVVFETYPAYPIVRVGIGYGFGYGWGHHHPVYVRHGHRRW
jgi:hypothetical protein